MTGAPAAWLWLRDLLGELAFHPPAGPAGPWTLGAVSGPAGVEVDVTAGTVRVVTTGTRTLLWEQRLDPAGPLETAWRALAVALARTVTAPVTPGMALALALRPEPATPPGSRPPPQTVRQGKNGGRFAPGRLRDAALTILTTHPETVFTVRTLARAVGAPNSEPALRDALRTWAHKGTIRRTGDYPASYQSTGRTERPPAPYTGPGLHLTGTVRYGETVLLVHGLLQAHPDNTFTAPQIIQALGERSTYSAVRQALHRLVTLGTVRLIPGTYPISHQIAHPDTTPHDHEENTVPGPHPPT